MVIGGGNSAAEENLFLTFCADKITILVREDSMSASSLVVANVVEHPEIEVRFNARVTEFAGNGSLESMRFRDGATGAIEQLDGHRSVIVVVVVGIGIGRRLLDRCTIGSRCIRCGCCSLLFDQLPEILGADTVVTITDRPLNGMVSLLGVPQEMVQRRHHEGRIGILGGVIQRLLILMGHVLNLRPKLLVDRDVLQRMRMGAQGPSHGPDAPGQVAHHC
ncbi:MAG: NAD-binding protein [Planctomycetes bacterium]|nr:NAD-binding protein [Planctomycetota bacterium]